MKVPDSVAANRRYIAFLTFIIFTTITNWNDIGTTTAVLQIALAVFALVEVILGVQRTKPTDLLGMLLNTIQHLKMNKPGEPDAIITTIENAIMFLMDNWEKLYHGLGKREEGDS